MIRSSSKYQKGKNPSIWVPDNLHRKNSVEKGADQRADRLMEFTELTGLENRQQLIHRISAKVTREASDIFEQRKIQIEVLVKCL